MKIRLTADTRVLLSAGTLVDVSEETARVIYKLGRCEIVSENEAVEKADEPKVDSSDKPKKKPAKNKE